ncbi:hypothetical protein ONZ45_g19375 [Pleurotus djamor]|nr:hypothetical protein ONZ45_g19375 [Pleurotus djamor]
MLSRRIPIPTPAPVQPTASALPAYLKRTQSIVSLPSRPQSRPASPPPGQRPGSPFRNRPQTSIPTRTQSPAPAPPSSLTPTDIEVTLIIRSIEQPITIEKPFNLSCSLVVVAPVKEAQSRTVHIVIQRLQASHVSAPTFSPRISSGFSTPSPTTAAFNLALVHNKILAAASRPPVSNPVSEEPEEMRDDGVPVLPPPYFNDVDEARVRKLSGVQIAGNSTLALEPIVLHAEGAATKAQSVQDFAFDYLPVKQGLVSIGGLRVLVVDDKVETGNATMDTRNVEVRTLREWDVITEANVGR